MVSTGNLDPRQATLQCNLAIVRSKFERGPLQTLDTIRIFLRMAPSQCVLQPVSVLSGAGLVGVIQLLDITSPTKTWTVWRARLSGG